MNKIRTFIIVILLSQFLFGQSYSHFRPLFSPKTTTIFHKLGDRSIEVKVSRYGESADLVMINMHDDEFTSVAAAKKFLEQEGGMLITIENSQKRNIRFRLMNRTYTFDPNRMFSREGITQSLKELGPVSPAAIEHVERFASRVLQLLPEDPSCIIALHNNTNGDFSITSYTAGNKRANDAKAVYVNPGEDPDDLFLTTDAVLYNQLAEKKYNVILQDNRSAKKDGSLSVYCGEKGIRYLNCETEHGRTAQYFEMIMAAGSFLERTNEPVVFYNFSVETNRVINRASGSDIYFGEKRIGRIRSIAVDESSGKHLGKLEMNKSFPVYDNMDFFITADNEGNYHFEVTVDPTKPRKKINPLEQNVVFKLRA